MFEYKVEVYKVKKAEAEMNRLAQEGWKVIAIMPDGAAGFGMVVTFERKVS